MKRKIKFLICFILLSAMLFSLCGCGGKLSEELSKTRRFNPLTIEEIREGVMKNFFDSDGKLNLFMRERWAYYWKKEGLTEDEYPEVELSDIYFVKDIWTDETDCFCVEFKPTGYLYGSRLRNFSYSHLMKGDVCPFNYYNVREEDRYVNSYYGAAPYCGMGTEGYVVSILGTEYDFSKGYYSVFNLKTKKFENNVYLGKYDIETSTWIKEENDKQ